MRLLAAFLCTVLAATACGDDGGAATCNDIREPEDPASLTHVIGEGIARYTTDPPTSGPHVALPALVGLLEAPLSPEAQVRVLEVGGVVVQFTDPDDEMELRTLLDASDVPLAIAPAESLPASVVATAWTWKLTCNAVDLAAIGEFMSTRTNEAPGRD